MARKFSLIILLTLGGCTQSKPYISIGHDAAVSGVTVQSYARTHNVSEAEALKQILSGAGSQREAKESQSGNAPSASKSEH